MPEEVVDTFWGHVDELAKRLKVVIIAFVVSLVTLLLVPGNLKFLQNLNYYEPWVSIFLRSIRERVLAPEVKLIALQMTDPITLYVMAALVFSIGITLPVFAYELYKFVDPALRSHEKRDVYPFVASVTTLFVVGAVFGFFILFPFFIWSMLPFFTSVGAEKIFSIMDFYNVLFFTIISTGLVFTIPAFFVLLVKYGIIHTNIFRRNRKYVYLGLVIAAMFISPGASPQGNLFLFAPMFILFELSMFLGSRYEKNQIVPNFQPQQLFPKHCKFCDAQLPFNSAFCPTCSRSQI